MTHFELPASLTKDNVMAVSQALRKTITSAPEIIIDCQHVNNIDSAGIAFLLTLKQSATAVNYQLVNQTLVIRNICNLYSITI